MASLMFGAAVVLAGVTAARITYVWGSIIISSFRSKRPAYHPAPVAPRADRDLRHVKFENDTAYYIMKSGTQYFVCFRMGTTDLAYVHNGKHQTKQAFLPGDMNVYYDPASITLNGHKVYLSPVRSVVDLNRVWKLFLEDWDWFFDCVTAHIKKRATNSQNSAKRCGCGHVADFNGHFCYQCARYAAR